MTWPPSPAPQHPGDRAGEISKHHFGENKMFQHHGNVPLLPLQPLKMILILVSEIPQVEA